MPWESLLAKGSDLLLPILFFVGIALLLRLLYGPKGFFRDPAWDAWNEEARLELERKGDAEEDKKLQERFVSYARAFYSGEAERDGPLELKLDHSLRVLAYAEELAASEPAFASRESARALRLAALFHDVGRFEQFRRFQTFSDALSCNHGAFGARIIRTQGFLQQESPDMRRIVLAAVAAHNRLTLPSSLSGRALNVLKGLRDADKLDILRVMEAHLAPGVKGDSVTLLHLKDEAGSWSAPVAKALEEGRVAFYSDMRFVNDFRILLCTWLCDLHFAASLRIVRRERRFASIVAGLEGAPEIEAKAKAFVEARLAE